MFSSLLNYESASKKLTAVGALPGRMTPIIYLSMQINIGVNLLFRDIDKNFQMEVLRFESQGMEL